MASGGVKVTALAPAKPTVVAPVVAPPAIPAAHFSIHVQMIFLVRVQIACHFLHNKLK